jgi:hypothetical protein
MSVTEQGTEIEELRARLERVESGLALLLAERYGSPATDFSGLRRTVARDMGELFADANRRARDRLHERTAVAQFTGANVEHIREFVGERASVVEDRGGLTVIQNGTPTYVPRGGWLQIDPDTDRITPTTSPLEEL